MTAQVIIDGVNLIDRVNTIVHYFLYPLQVMRGHTSHVRPSAEVTKLITDNLILGSVKVRELYHMNLFPGMGPTLLGYVLRIENLHDMFSSGNYVGSPYLPACHNYILNFKKALMAQAVESSARWLIQAREAEVPPLAPIPEVRVEATILRTKRVYRKRKTQLEKLIEDALSDKRLADDKRFRSVMRQITPKQ
jgi:hypothetical protein